MTQVHLKVKIWDYVVIFNKLTAKTKGFRYLFRDETQGLGIRIFV